MNVKVSNLVHLFTAAAIIPEESSRGPISEIFNIDDEQ